MHNAYPLLGTGTDDILEQSKRTKSPTNLPARWNRWAFHVRSAMWSNFLFFGIFLLYPPNYSVDGGMVCSRVIGFFFFNSCGSKDWAQGLQPARQTLSCIPWVATMHPLPWHQQWLQQVMQSENGGIWSFWGWGQRMRGISTMAALGPQGANRLWDWKSNP